MRFSIITVTWNSAATLPATMASLAAQSCTDYEWIVIDGASEDDTMALVGTFQGPRGTCVSAADSGIYDAMNKGLACARGDYVFFLNSDDRLVDARVLADISEELDRVRGIDLLYGNVIYTYPDRRLLRKFAHINAARLPFEDLCHQAVFARRDLFTALGGFNERYRTNADYDWLLRVFASGARTQWVDRTVAEFRTGGAHMRNLEAAVAERRAVRLQYMSPAQLAWGSLRTRLRYRWSRMTRGVGPGQSPL